MIPLAALLVAAATWCLLPPWRSERTQGLAGGSPAERRQRRIRARLPGGLGPAARRHAARKRLRGVQALGALAAELESGQPPLAALAVSGGEPTVWPTAVAAASVGEDVAAALAQDAVDQPALRSLAACWRVSASTGTGFAAAVSRLAESARAAEAVRVDLEGELAGPRATARMLAILPCVGVAFGVMLGSDPISWLLTTGAGLACLVGGITLTVLGMVWTGRIAAAVERLL